MVNEGILPDREDFENIIYCLSKCQHGELSLQMGRTTTKKKSKIEDEDSLRFIELSLEGFPEPRGHFFSFALLFFKI